MNVQKPIVQYNLIDELPSYGEDRSGLSYIDSNAVVTVWYDRKDQHEQGTIELRFQNVVSVTVSIVPGVEMAGVHPKEGRYALHKVVEYTDSIPAEKWSAHLHWLENKIRHYQLILPEEGKKYDLFAEGFVVPSAPNGKR